MRVLVVLILLVSVVWSANAQAQLKDVNYFSAAQDCMTDHVGAATSIQGIQMSSQDALNNCAAEFQEARRLMQASGIPRAEMDRLETRERAELQLAFVDYVRDHKAKKNVLLRRNFYTNMRICATTAALKYERLKDGDRTIFFQVITKDCATPELMGYLSEVDDPNSDELAGGLNLCAIVEAIDNLNFIPGITADPRYRGCPDAKEALFRDPAQ